MPISIFPIRGISKTIEQNIYFKIVKDVLSSIEIPYDTLIIAYKDIETTLTDNKPNTSSVTNKNIPTTISKRRIIATVVDDYDIEDVTPLTPYENIAFPIFKDTDINTYIYPLYIRTNISIEFSFISSSKTEANFIRDTLRVSISKTRNVNIHEIEYNILIPDEVQDFIADVYDLKSRLFPQTLEEYFRTHSTKRIFPITDMVNKKNTTLAIYEKQIRIPGIFDISGIPDKLEVDSENNNYKLSFNYNLTLDLPKFFVLKYPVTICNKLLPSKYLEHLDYLKKNTQEEYTKCLNYTHFGNYNLSIFEAHRFLENRIDIKFPKNVPIFDDFREIQSHPGYVIIYSFLTTIDESNKKFLFNLKDLTPYSFTDTMLNYIRTTEKDYITKPYNSFIYLGLHQDDTFFDAPLLAIDSDFNLSSTRELDLVKTTRVTLSFLLDITVLSDSSLTRLLNNLPLFMLYVEEYVKFFNYFKNEIAHLNFSLSQYLRSLTLVFNQFVQTNNLQALIELIRITRSNSYLFNAFFGYISNNFPNLFHYLELHGLISRSEFNDNIGKDEIGKENYGMRTVMFSSIITLEKDNM